MSEENVLLQIKCKQTNTSKQIANERILQNMIMIQTDRKSWAKLN